MMWYAPNCMLCALQVVGEFCMDLAISKAKKVGCSWVAASGVGLLNTFFSISGLFLYTFSCRLKSLWYCGSLHTKSC